jgi:hypothetical protein
MKKYHRILAACLSVLLFVPTLVLPASAAAPRVSTDESAYVNLDYYGKVQNVSIVKSCSLNGNTGFTDYGSYSKVTNMSGTAAPSVSDGSVSWSLPKDTVGRFYYECTPKDGNLALPWTFDVSYKLNGVPTDASKLAGVSGLVEIDIHAAPNKNVSDYEKNNLLLQVGTAVKMKNTQSVEAPGAQVQALGEYKAVLFAGLPGEEKDFAIRIGTTSFESTGVVMMMVPGTLDQFSTMKDLSKDKDTVRTSLDAVNTGTDRILDSLAAMSSGLSQTQAGLSYLDGARGTVSAGKGGVYKSADQALASLTDITNKTTAMIPHMQKAEQLITDVNADVNSMTASVDALSPRLISLSQDLSTVQNNISQLRNALDDLDDESDKRESTISELKAALKSSLATTKADAQSAKTVSDRMKTQSDALSINTKTLSYILQQISSNALAHTSTATPTLPDPYLSAILASIGTLGGNLNNTVGTTTKYTTPVLDSLAGLLDASDSITAAVDAISSQISGSSDGLTAVGLNTVDVLNDYLAALDDGHDAADKLLKNSNHVGTDLQTLLDQSRDIIAKIDALNKTANQYKDGAVQTLKDTESLTSSLTGGLTNTKSFLSSLETLMKNGGSQLDNGTRKSLNGLIQVLQKSVDSIGNIPTIKNSNDTVKNTVDNEIDKIEDKSNVLNLDYEAKPVSFTSSKNSSPTSIQIVLRTQEISKDKDNSAVKDAEKASADPGPWVRIQNLFSNLWKSICSLFGK